MPMGRKLLTFLLFIAIYITSCSSGQNGNNAPERRKSPITIAKVNHANTYIKVVYGQPYKKGREIFGELIPYGEVWRTGANEATELTTTKAIQFGDKKLPAGTYALFSIPNKSEWTIILNSQLGQWGAFDYNSDNDVMRIKVSSETTEDVTEAFTIKFTEVENNSTNLVMNWDNTVVSIPISFISTDQASSTS